MGETNTAATSDITPTGADLAHDLPYAVGVFSQVLPTLRPGSEEYIGLCLALAACRRAIAAEAELKQLKTGTYCAYCGHTEPIDGDGERIAEHIRTCEKHPMRAVEARVKELEQTLLQGVLQLKGMRDEVDRLLQEAEEFQKQMEAKGE